MTDGKRGRTMIAKTGTDESTGRRDESVHKVQNQATFLGVYTSSLEKDRQEVPVNI
jgi:hypothetical protein